MRGEDLGEDFGGEDVLGQVVRGEMDGEDGDYFLGGEKGLED